MKLDVVYKSNIYIVLKLDVFHILVGKLNMEIINCKIKPKPRNVLVFLMKIL